LRNQGDLDREEAGPVEVHAALSRYLGRNPAGLVLANLEDLRGETEPQNVPGTSSEQRANWRRKTALSLEELQETPEVIAALQGLSLSRAQPGRDSGAPTHRPAD
jgi:4-alpha-glucanotransferase